MRAVCGDADELRQLEPALSRDYVRGVLVRENGHTSNPLALVERLLEHFLRSGGELVQSRATPDVIYAFGHGHVGMTAAPMTGKLVADLVTGRPPSIDIVAFAPGRFA